MSVTWDIELADGSSFAAPEHAIWLQTGKMMFVVSALYGESGRGKKGGGGLMGFYYSLRALIVWMSRRRVFSFRDLSPAHVIGYRNCVNTTQSHKSEIPKGLSSRTRSKLFGPIRILVFYPEKFGIQGALLLDPNDILDTLRVKVTEVEPTKRIPDGIFLRIVDAAIKHLEQAKVQSPQGIEDQGAARSAGFIVIAAFVGMRISEITSIKRDNPLRPSVLPDGRKLITISGTLFKTSREALGEPADWVAGWDEPSNPVRLAVEVLSQLPNPAGYDRLFVPLTDEEITYDNPILSYSAVMRMVHFFADRIAGVPRSEWLLSAHQFRKTFARFVALSGPKAGFALMRHFKHVSMQMTERYYPNDPELLNDIYEAHEELIAERLDTIYGATRLGGIKGTQIASGYERFRGAPGAKARRELTQMTLADPRASFKLTPYGMCIYEAERAKCKGLVENVGLAMCMTCPNHAIDESHVPFWATQLEAIEDAIATREALGIVDIGLYRERDQALEVLRKLGAA
jgi:integrase